MACSQRVVGLELAKVAAIRVVNEVEAVASWGAVLASEYALVFSVLKHHVEVCIFVV